MRIPLKGGIYSVNEGNAVYWDEKTVQYFQSLKAPPAGASAEEAKKFKPYSSRYIGSMVADAYRTLLYGGVFAYPADKKSPKGKLRILYECAPMAMVFENGERHPPSPQTGIGRHLTNTITAGGQAVDGNMKRMLEVVPNDIHDRSGIFMGSYDEVERVKSFHK